MKSPKKILPLVLTPLLVTGAIFNWALTSRQEGPGSLRRQDLFQSVMAAVSGESDPGPVQAGGTLEEASWTEESPSGTNGVLPSELPAAPGGENLSSPGSSPASEGPAAAGPAAPAGPGDPAPGAPKGKAAPPPKAPDLPGAAAAAPVPLKAAPAPALPEAEEPTLPAPLAAPTPAADPVSPPLTGLPE